MEIIKLLIVDDDELTRDVLKAALSTKDGFVAQETGDGLSAVRNFRDDRPDVVLLDLKMPSMDGIETLKEMIRIDVGVPVIILTGHGDIPTAVEAMRCGAYDFIVKPPQMDTLRATLKTAAQVCEGKAVGPGLKDPDAHGPAAEKALKQYDTLTSREQEIFKLTVQGLSSMQIASHLSISHRTVESHRENIMKKLNVRNRTDLIHYAIRSGILR